MINLSTNNPHDFFKGVGQLTPDQKGSLLPLLQGSWLRKAPVEKVFQRVRQVDPEEAVSLLQEISEASLAILGMMKEDDPKGWDQLNAFNTNLMRVYSNLDRSIRQLLGPILINLEALLGPKRLDPKRVAAITQFLLADPQHRLLMSQLAKKALTKRIETVDILRKKDGRLPIQDGPTADLMGIVGQIAMRGGRGSVAQQVAFEVMEAAIPINTQVHLDTFSLILHQMGLTLPAHFKTTIERGMVMQYSCEQERRSQLQALAARLPQSIRIDSVHDSQSDGFALAANNLHVCQVLETAIRSLPSEAKPDQFLKELQAIRSHIGFTERKPMAVEERSDWESENFSRGGLEGVRRVTMKVGDMERSAFAPLDFHHLGAIKPNQLVPLFDAVVKLDEISQKEAVREWSLANHAELVRGQTAELQPLPQQIKDAMQGLDEVLKTDADKLKFLCIAYKFNYEITKGINSCIVNLGR